jgi:short-subunit dehydrogenase
MVDLNVGTLTDLCRAVAPAMIERGRGAILNVASTAAFQTGPNKAVYFATKAYVLSFTEALHEELRPHGIQVSALCPGPTKTEFGDVAGFGGSNGMFDRLAMNAPEVVRAGLKGLARNKAVVVPGIVNKTGAASTRFAPRRLVRKIAGAIKY